MQHTLGQAELLQLQNTTSETNTNNKPSNSELVEKERQEGTGFDIVGNKDHGYFIALGNYRLTASYPLKATCKKMIKEKDYELLLGLIQAGIDSNDKMKLANEMSIQGRSLGDVVKATNPNETMAKAYDGVNRTMHTENANK